MSRKRYPLRLVVNLASARKKSLFLLCVGALALVLMALSARQDFVSPADAEGVDVTVSLSKPANGTFYSAGERATVTIALKDKAGATLTKDAFATLGLYAYGPQETTKTVTAVKLLNATADRSKTPHHYIDLLTNPDVRGSGNTLRYTLQPVSNEEPGTYTLSVRAVMKGNPPVNQTFALTDFQLGTATVEKQIVEKEKCAACHLGTSSGQFYFAHVDPSARSPYGSPALESVPVRTCKSCHNNDGYSAYVSPATGQRVPDQIVNRVHSIHMGEGLKNPINIDANTGVFRDYVEVVFPANVKNCTACHVDNRWKTEPSRLACGTCHDNTWFGDAASMPQTAKAHPGGPQANDSTCATCHPADTGGIKAVAEAHKVPPPAFAQTIELSMSSPANGQFYVAGEKPTVTITVKDAATGKTIDPRTMVEPADSTKIQPNEYRRYNLFVSGPRADTRPVLTTAVGDRTKTYANNELRVLKDASKADPRITRTDTSIVYQVADVKDLKPGTYSAWVETLPAPPDLGGWVLINFQVGTATVEKTVAGNCTQCHGDTRMHAGFFAVEFNPDICKSCHDKQRQMEGKVGWNNSNNGFGAAPLARRAHGVHFGKYLDKPSEVHQTVDYSGVIFPQDVRNCTKCHDPKGSASWQENPSRLACTGCHDKDDAIAHTQLMTKFSNPTDQWSDDRTETCKVCHGVGRDFAVEKMHSISNPYKPPYPREPE